MIPTMMKALLVFKRSDIQVNHIKESDSFICYETNMNGERDINYEGWTQKGTASR